MELQVKPLLDRPQGLSSVLVDTGTVLMHAHDGRVDLHRRVVGSSE